MGVEIKCGQAIGSDVTMAELREKHDAVLVATGLGQARSTRVPGTDHPNVASAIVLLDKVTRGEPIDLPGPVVVIGGGNVAFDIARSLARLQKQRDGAVAVTLVALEGLAWTGIGAAASVSASTAPPWPGIRR